MSVNNWSSIPWSSFPAEETNKGASAWYKTQVPYQESANALQNVEIWIPKQSTSDAVPDPESIPQSKGIWVIYIHGGAWRDPLVDSTSFTATVRDLLSNHPTDVHKIAGLASINYSLSPHPLHPSHPAPIPSASDPGIPSRSAAHPDHIRDVLTAISFLQQTFAISNNYILSGHSCGATLAFQVAMSHAKWNTTTPTPQIPKPIAVLGLNGLYDMPALISTPGLKHAHLAQLYKGFTLLAFGADEAVWREISPTSVNDWSAEWTEGIRAVLVQSQEDSLVPYSQTEMMMEKLKGANGEKLVLGELGAGGDHNDLWLKGDRLAEIIVEVVGDVQGQIE